MSLFERLGGAATVKSVTLLVFQRIMADRLLAYYFEDIAVHQQVDRFCSFVAAAFGNSEMFIGRNLKEAHRHLQITGRDFDRFMGHLEAVLVEQRLASDVVAEVLDILASYKDQIVYIGD